VHKNLKSPKSKEIEAVLRISRAVSQSLDLKQIFEMACRMSAQALRADRCSIGLLLDKNVYEIAHSYRRNPSYPSIQGLKVDLSKYPHIVSSVRKRKPVHLFGIERLRLSVEESALFKKLGTKVFLAVPVIVDQKVLGALHLSKVHEFPHFSLSEITLFQTIANEVALAIKNARSVKSLREDRERLRFLRQQALLANERLRFLMFSTSAVIYASRTSGDYGATFITENVQRITGYDPNSFIKNSSFWIDRIHPEDKQRILQDLPNIFKKGYHTYEYRFRCKNGKYIWMRDEMKLILDDKGQPLEIVGYWMDITERKKSEKQITRLTAKVMEAHEEERKKTAERLHDVIIQDLAAIQLDLKMLQLTPPRDINDVISKLKEDEKLLSDTLGNLSDLTSDLRPRILDELGLFSAVRWYAGRFKERTNLKVSLRIDKPDVKLSPQVETTLFRIVQESLTNVYKHSKATMVTISLLKKAKDFQIIIQDDGIGFQPDPTYSGTRLGLLRIKESVKLIGGKLKIISKKGKGTKLDISFPR